MTARSGAVFVSGCYELLHAGHLQFFREARALGDRLVVCFASAEALWRHRQRRSPLPDDHKRRLLESLRMVDEVVMGEGEKLGLDFEDHFLRIRPRVLAVTEDDPYPELKRDLCRRAGADYVVLPKTPPDCGPISTRSLVQGIQAPDQAPLRVDFAGGWLDVPRFSRPGGFVVNCAISPLVSLKHWPYPPSSGLGGSAAWALLNGHHGVDPSLSLGAGWQDAAVIRETGLCAWRSGPAPALDIKRPGDFLAGRMALVWTGKPTPRPNLADLPRDFSRIQQAGIVACQAVNAADLDGLAEAMRLSAEVQRLEGMPLLPEIPGALAVKYCGGGWGGHALALFREPEERRVLLCDDRMLAVEPYLRPAVE